jgi:hypothetical protein
LNLFVPGLLTLLLVFLSCSSLFPLAFHLPPFPHPWFFTFSSCSSLSRLTFILSFCSPSDPSPPLFP